MKKIWKTFAGRCIYQSIDGIKVHQNLVYRWLTHHHESAIQTMINRYKPHLATLQYIQPLTFALRSLPSNYCLLGLGGGAILHALSNLNQDIQSTVVESCEEIINVAHNHFMLDRIKNLEILHQDANIFVDSHKKRYQHLLIDIYTGNLFPSQCQHSHFFQACKNRLQDHGFLAINSVGADDGWSHLTYLREHFGQKIVCIPVKNTGNIVMIATKSPSVNHLLDLFTKSDQLKTMIWDARWGYVAELRI